jgi:hypothetical protein
MSISGNDKPAVYPPAFNKIYESIYGRPRSYLQLLEDNRAFARRAVKKRLKKRAMERSGKSKK